MDANVLAVNIPEAARRLGLSQRTVAALVSKRQLASRKVGRRRIIPVMALEAFVRNERSEVRVVRHYEEGNGVSNKG